MKSNEKNGESRVTSRTSRLSVRSALLGVEVPGDVEHTGIHVSVVQLGEERWRHVEVSIAAGGAEVSDEGLGGLAVLVVGDLHPLAAVSAVVGPVLRGVEGDNLVVVVVPLEISAVT